MSVPGTGFVLRVIRERNEKRGADSGARYRTVGRYECYYNGQRLSDDPRLSGATAEPRGPGDNTVTGRKNARRIAAGQYPLGTHNGTNYATFFAGTDKRPAIYVHDTADRSAILIHPGASFKSSVGCINLTGSLVNPQDNISPRVSHDRVVALISAMQARLQDRFPSSGRRRIRDAWLVVEGEP